MKFILAFLISTVAADILPRSPSQAQSVANPAGCPVITCVMFCNDGLQKDEKGCDKCSCARGGGKLATGITSCKRDANGCCSELGMAFCPEQRVCLSTSADAVVKCQSWSTNPPSLSASAPRPQLAQQQQLQPQQSTLPPAQQTFPAPIQKQLPPQQQSNLVPSQPQASVSQQQTFFQPIPKQLPPIPTQQPQQQQQTLPSPPAQQAQPSLTYFPPAQQTNFPPAQQTTNFPPAQSFFASQTNFAQSFTPQNTNFVSSLPNFPSNSMTYNYLPASPVTPFAPSTGSFPVQNGGLSAGFAGSVGLPFSSVATSWTNLPVNALPVSPVGSTWSGISSGQVIGSASSWGSLPSAPSVPSSPPAGFTGLSPADSSSSAPAGLGCPEVMCAMYCENGFVKDGRGCDTCSCAGSSSSWF